VAASDHPAERRTGVVDGGGWEALSPPAARAPAARSSAAPPRAPAPGRAGDQDHVRHPEPAVERRAPLNGWRSVLRSLAATALGLGARRGRRSTAAAAAVAAARPRRTRRWWWYISTTASSFVLPSAAGRAVAEGRVVAAAVAPARRAELDVGAGTFATLAHRLRLHAKVGW
jgi:hypothetical protein